MIKKKKTYSDQLRGHLINYNLTTHTFYFLTLTPFAQRKNSKNNNKEKAKRK